MNELVALRNILSEDAIDAFIVGSGDAHQSEYVGDFAKRRAFISKFTGSAGTAVITASHALLWTDAKELSSEWTLMKMGRRDVPTMNEWLCQNLSPGSSVGVDAFLITANVARELQRDLQKYNITLKAVERNPIDVIWGVNQPAAPAEAIRPHPIEFSGESHTDKIAKLRITLKNLNAGAMVVTMLDEIAWLFNIRGSDVVFNPVVTAYAVLSSSGPCHLFVSPSERVTEELRSHLGPDVQVHPYEDIENFLARLAHDVNTSKQKIFVDANTINWRLYQTITNVLESAMSLLEMNSIINMAKSIKNEVELEGFRNCHVRDGVALTAYFSWLENTMTQIQQSGSEQYPSEYEVALKLEEFRKQMDKHISPSFDTISSYGANGAIIHYHPSRQLCSSLGCESLYLCDSGAQYLDGTTDVTRTMHFGTPTQRMKDCFTYVLKGHIALAMAVFPEGMIGSRLDTVARAPLWAVGLDYNHGTGHGVGSFLCVHEGPQSIGFRARPGGESGFRVGMTVSNEPGYYEDGAFGIRVETICITVPVVTENCFGADQYCGFETVTMCPIQQKLINKDLLTDREIGWLNSYHAEVRRKLMPLMQQKFPQAVDFLIRETEVIVL